MKTIGRFEQVEVPDQNRSFLVHLLTKSFGRWTLGYSWVDVSLGQAVTTGLCLYAKLRTDRLPFRRIVFSLKEGVTFFADIKVPPRWAGKLLAEATSQGDWDAKEVR